MYIQSKNSFTLFIVFAVRMIEGIFFYCKIIFISSHEYLIKNNNLLHPLLKLFLLISLLRFVRFSSGIFHAKREKTPLSENRSQACLDYVERVGVPERNAGIVTDEQREIRRNRLSERRSQACLDYPERQRLPERKRWRKIDKENDWVHNCMYFLLFVNKQKRLH